MKLLFNVIISIVFLMVGISCTPKQPTIEVPVALPTAISEFTPMDIPPTEEPIPAWLLVPVKDAKTGESFTINDLRGKVVLVEGMATWCPTCWKQGREFKKLYGLLGDNTDLVIISLTLDLKEDSQALIEYSKIDDFKWQFVTSTLPMYHDLGNRYGALYLDPTLSPLLIVDRKGKVMNYVRGVKNADELKQILDPLLKEG